MGVMVSQHDLGRRFKNGATNGSASNVQLQEVNGGVAVVGYGWAVYAYRNSDGHITYYDGWYGYSQSTSSQISKMGLRTAADTIKYESPELNSFNSL